VPLGSKSSGSRRRITASVSFSMGRQCCFGTRYSVSSGGLMFQARCGAGASGTPGCAQLGWPGHPAGRSGTGTIMAADVVFGIRNVPQTTDHPGDGAGGVPCADRATFRKRVLGNCRRPRRRQPSRVYRRARRRSRGRQNPKTGEYAAVVLFRRKLTAWRTGAGVVAPEVEFVG